MDRIFNLSKLHKSASSEDLKQGSFGIEWEGLRVRENGELSLSPHPEIFGNKLSNPYITALWMMMSSYGSNHCPVYSQIQAKSQLQNIKAENWQKSQWNIEKD